MADITETDNKFLNSLVQDCITYKLSERSTRIYQTQVQAHIIIIFEAEEGARSISSEYADMA